MDVGQKQPKRLFEQQGPAADSWCGYGGLGDAAVAVYPGARGSGAFVPRNAVGLVQGFALSTLALQRSSGQSAS